MSDGLPDMVGIEALYSLNKTSDTMETFQLWFNSQIHESRIGFSILTVQ